MANVAPVVVNKGHYVRVTWPLMANGDIGLPYEGEDFADRSVQVLGTFGAGGSVSIQGSNDGGTTYATLDDASSTALAITVAKIKTILDPVEFLRPNVTAGDGTTAISVVLFARRMRG